MNIRETESIQHNWSREKSRLFSHTFKVIPSTRATPFCLWTLMRVLNCLKETVGFIASSYAVLNIFMYMFFVLLAVIVVIFFCTGPVNDTFFIRSSWGLPLSIESAMECAPPSWSRWRKTYKVNEYMIVYNRNKPRN